MMMPDGAGEQSEALLKQVDLMLMIDAVCDNAADDVAALTGAVSLIAQAVEAEVGLLSWFDADTQRLELRALADRLGALTPAHHADLFRLSQAACALPALRPVSVDAAAADLGQIFWLGAPLRVKSELLGKLKEGASITFRVDPKILGGLVVRVGDRVVDGSVAGQMLALRQSL